MQKRLIEHQVLGSCIAGTASGIIGQQKAKVTDCFANSAINSPFRVAKDGLTIANSKAIPDKLSPVVLRVIYIWSEGYYIDLYQLYVDNLKK